MNEPADVQLFLIGRTGQGLSATGNTILGRNAFTSSSSPSSLTSEIECELSEFNCQCVKVIDGPSMGHTHMNTTNDLNLHMASMENAITENPHGYDAFLLVVKFGEKYTTEMNETFDCLRKIFGQDFVRNFCILVVTCGDLFKQETGGGRKSIEEWIDEHPGVLRDLMNECQRRVVMFDNLTTDGTTRYEQVEQLLKIVDDLKSQGTRYTDDNFAHARKGRQRYIVEAQKLLIQEEAMLEAELILNGVEDVQSVNGVETKIVHLWSLQIRIHNLSTRIGSLDNCTGVLKEMIRYLKLVKKNVDDQTYFHVKMVNEREMFQQQKETTQLVKQVRQAENTDTKIAKELWSSEEFHATNKRPETQSNKNETCVTTQVDLLLIGKTGVGKSATGNSILRRRAFKSSSSVFPETKTVSYGVSEFDGRVLKLVDSPDFTYVENAKLVEVMVSAMTANLRGYNAFLLLVRYGTIFAKENQNTVNLLKKIFGQDFVKNFCILVFTHGDFLEYENKETFQEWCNERTGTLKDLIEECDKRVVLFDNITNDLAKQSDQITNLLKIVDNMSSRGQMYMTANFVNARRVQWLAAIKKKG